MGGNLVNSSEFELGNSQTGMKMSARKMTSETILTFKNKKWKSLVCCSWKLWEPYSFGWEMVRNVDVKSLKMVGNLLISKVYIEIYWIYFSAMVLAKFGANAKMSKWTQIAIRLTVYLMQVEVWLTLSQNTVTWSVASIRVCESQRRWRHSRLEHQLWELGRRKGSSGGWHVP